MTARRALWALIAISTSLRMGWAAGLGPGNDEAYHYLFAVHTDWGYIDHPPMLAAVEALGLMLAGGRPSPFALRLGFIALFAGSTWLMARLTARHFGAWAGVLAAFALNAAPYYAAAAGAFALPDGPFLFFWLLTVEALDRAIEAPDSLAPWAGVGLAWGMAMLSKYLAVFLPIGAFAYFASGAVPRRCLRRPGPYLAFALGLLLFSPVLWWNLRHGWASFAFQGGRALSGTRFRPDLLLAAVGGQALYLAPWIWASLLVILVRRGRVLFDGSATIERLLLCQAVPPLALFAAVSCTRPVLPHWSLVGLLPLFPLLGAAWAVRLAAYPGRMRRVLALYAAVPAAVAALAVIQAHTGIVPVAHDPTADFYGWDQVASELGRRGLLEPDGAFLFTSRWYHSGQLAFATRGAAPVLCYNARHAQGFAFWSRPEESLGRDGIFVGVNDCATEVAYFARWFRRVDSLGEFPVLRGGRPIRRIHLYRFVRQTKPFPFGNAGPAPRSARMTDLRAGATATTPRAGRRDVDQGITGTGRAGGCDEHPAGDSSPGPGVGGC